MAKKVLTPEEVQAKMEKKAAKRKLFFGTFTKALAFFLAIAIAWSLAAIAFTPAIGGNTVVSGGTQTQTGTSDGTGSSSGDAMVDLGGSSSTGDSTGAGDSTGSGDSAGSGDAAATGVSKADAVKALNDATSAAAKKSYTWERKCYYTEALDVGDATDTLNDIIHRVDENADLNSVVGGFLGITGTKDDPAWTAEVTNGKRPTEGTKMNDDKYLMIATKLTEGDVMQYQVDGNKYTFQLNACNNPQKGADNSLAHVTNDFITLDEVNAGISGALGSLSFLVSAKSCNVDFKTIIVKAEINNGNLVSYSVSYHMQVNSLELSIGVSGKGAGDMICTYKNFK